MNLLNTKWQGEVTRDTGSTYGLRVNFNADGVARFEIRLNDGTWDDRTGAWEWQQTDNHVMFGSNVGKVTYRCTINGFRMSGSGDNMAKRFKIWLDKRL